MKSEIIKYLVLGKGDKEIVEALINSGLSEKEAKEALKEAKGIIKKARIPSREELSLLTSALICDAVEAQQFSIAQKLLGDLMKISRVDNSIDFEMPEYKTSEQFLTDLLKSAHKMSPAMLGNVARYISALNLSKIEKAENEEESTDSDGAEELAKNFLKLIK